jgi:thiaminase
MSKKKSYMNRENVLSEGFFDKIKKGLAKLTGNSKDNKSVKKSLKDLEKSMEETKKKARKYADSLGIDYDQMEKEFRDLMDKG